MDNAPQADMMQNTGERRPTYADKVKCNDPVVLVVPKQNQTSLETRKYVMQTLDPTKIPIGNLRNAAKCTVVLEGNSRRNRNRLEKLQYVDDKQS